MDLSKIPVLAALSRRMEWLSERQKVLAQNIANADTPGYRPFDVKPQTFKSLFTRMYSDVGGKLSLATSDSHHQTSRVTEARFSTEKVRQPTDVEASGNAVVLEEQLAKLSNTQLEYAAAANLYRKHIGLIQSALGRRSS